MICATKAFREGDFDLRENFRASILSEHFGRGQVEVGREIFDLREKLTTAPSTLEVQPHDGLQQSQSGQERGVCVCA